jgi:hypothetical protein
MSNIQKYKVIGSIDDNNNLKQKIVPPKSWLEKFFEKMEVFTVGFFFGVICGAVAVVII